LKLFSSFFCEPLSSQSRPPSSRSARLTASRTWSTATSIPCEEKLVGQKADPADGAAEIVLSLLVAVVGDEASSRR
jgi:hypothetical protein